MFIGAGNYTPNDDEDTTISYIGGISGSKDSYLEITYEDVEQLPLLISFQRPVLHGASQWKQRAHGGLARMDGAAVFFQERARLVLAHRQQAHHGEVTA